MTSRHVAIGTAMMATAAVASVMYGSRGPSPTKVVRDTVAVVEAAQGLHHLVTGSFVPPKPGMPVDLRLLELEEAGDRVYTFSILLVSNSARAYAADAEKVSLARRSKLLVKPDPELAKAVHSAIARLQSELPPFNVADPVVSMQAKALSEALAVLDADVR